MAEKKTNAMRMADRCKINYEIFSFDVDEAHLDAITVAENIGVDIKEVYKTLVLQGSDKNYYICVINGMDELDLKKTAKAFGVKSISMIHVSEINKITGYIRGGCSPIGMKKQFKTLIDERAENMDYIIVSGGKRGLQIKMLLKDLKTLVGADIADLARR